MFYISISFRSEQVHESTQKDDDDLTMATSFEFIAPSAYKRNRDEMIDEPNNLPNKALSQQDISESPCSDRDESIYVQVENPDDKENIPPIDDKENIPPRPPAPSRSSPPIRQDIERPNVFKTPPDQTIAGAAAAAAAHTSRAKSSGADLSVLSNDLQIGVDLINALIDSRGTDAVTKKKLIRKIVRHLLRSKDTKDITQMIMSYTTDKSNSKISGVSVLGDEDEKSDSDTRSRVEHAEKDTISGISTLNSSSSSASHSAVIPPKPHQIPPNNGENERNKSDDADRDERAAENEQIAQSDRQKRDVDDCGTDSKVVKEWLLPVTQSEIEKEMARNAAKSQQQQQHQPKPIETAASNEQLNADRAQIATSRCSKLLNRLDTEKKTHYAWIDQEIEHLKKLKKLLKQINTSESDVRSCNKGAGNISDEKTNSVYAKYNRDYFTVYENFRRTRKQHEISTTDESSTLIGLNFIIYFFYVYSNDPEHYFQIHRNPVTTVHIFTAKWAAKVNGYIKQRLNRRHRPYRPVQSSGQTIIMSYPMINQRRRCHHHHRHCCAQPIVDRVWCSGIHI